MKSSKRSLLLVVAATALACAGMRGGQGTVSLEAFESYWPDRRDYMSFRAAHRDLVLEPNYLPFMVHRFATTNPTGDALVFCRWPDERMPLAVFVEPPEIPEELQNEFSPVDPAIFGEAVVAALARWESELEGVVRFERVDDALAADLRIRLLGEEAPRPHPEAKVLGRTEALKHACRGHGWDPEEERMRVDFAVSELEIYVADEFGLLTRRQVHGVALHELGHALGMRGHSPLESDLMYPVVRDRIQDQLSAQDIHSFVSLYRIPNGSHYGWVHAGNPPPRPEPGPPSGAPELELAPYVDGRHSFSIRIPAHWIGVETANGYFAANGPLWDHDASLEVVLSRYESIDAFLARYGRGLFDGTWLRGRQRMIVNGRPALRIAVDDEEGRFAQNYWIIELPDEQVMLVVSQCPVTHRREWEPLLAASLATLDFWVDSRTRRPGRRR